ncbi:MAG: ABC transporter permease [Planctomycetota bacterium]|nr:ABC transporter permease [Planctomycetota bacterium]
MLNALVLAFQALNANKLRSALTMLGTIIGVGCVVALWNVGGSGRQFVGESLESFGRNLLIVSPRYGGDEEDQRRNKYHPLKVSDVTEMQELSPSVQDASPVIFSGARAIYGARFCRAEVNGCFPSYLTIRNWTLELGMPFSDADVRSGNRVVLLGADVARELFGALDPTGRVIRLDREPFTVIGVLKAKGSLFGSKQDNVILAPFTSIADHMGWGRQVHVIFASARTRDLIPQAKNEIRLAIREIQSIAADRRDPVDVKDLGEMADAVDRTLLAFTLLLGAIGMISLLVGGIGIMNIMLVSVTERTREIGLRMALGATDFDILMQFLVESMVLGGLGGLVGAAGGAGMAALTVKVLSMLMERPWPFVLSWASVAASLVFAACVGLFFGLYPAWRASRLDPIVALRRE